MTSLAQQLQRLALPQGRAGTVTEGKHRKSLLFDSKEAATLDRETFYAIGVNGLQELENIDPNFQEFENTLFDEASKSLERSIQTKEINARLDRKIQQFLLRLSPFFLLKPAQKATEWLIHRFCLHEYNVDDLLACVFPYHDTKIFVRVVQLLNLQDDSNKWHWLQPIQTPGVPLSRTTVINQCYKNPGFLHFVCELVPSAIKVHKQVSTHSADDDDPLSLDGEVPSSSTESLLRVVTCFYCAAVVGAIEVANPVKEKLLAGILPYVLKGLKSKFADHQASSYMITCQLAIKVKMKTDLVDPIIRSICKHLTPALAQEGLSCVAVLCHTQPIRQFPESAFRKLCAFASTVSTLELLSQAANSTSLLKLFLTRLVRATMRGETEENQDNAGGEERGMYSAMLQGIFHRVHLEVNLRKETAKMLLTEYVNARRELRKQKSVVVSLKESVSHVVAAFERRYPEAMDVAIGSFMSQDNIDSKDQKLVQEIISLSVSASKHQTISGTKTTLILSLNHANADVRLAAVQHLKERIEAGESLEEFCIESLLQRLQDDKLQVANAGLQIGESLCRLLPQDKLFAILTGILQKGKMKTSKGLTSIKLSLKLLGNGALWKLSEAERSSLVPFVMPYMILRSNITSETDMELIDIIKTSTMPTDLKIFCGIEKAYHRYRLDKPHSTVTDSLIEILAFNLANCSPQTQQHMIASLAASADQPRPHQAFYRVLLDFLLVRAMRLIEDQAQKLLVAQVLLQLLQEDVKKLLDPDLTLIQFKEPLSRMSGNHANLPQEMHAHLSNLLMQRQRRQRGKDNSTIHQSQVETTLWCLESIVREIKMPQNLKSQPKMWASVRPNCDLINSYLTWLLHLVDLLTQAAAVKEKQVQQASAFKNILTKVVQNHLCTPDLLWNFLCLVWILPHELQSSLYPVSVFYRARCLHLGLTSAKDKSMTSDVVTRLLGQESEVLASLLVVMSSDLEPIRRAAVHCLQSLLANLNGDEHGIPYIQLAQFLVSKGEEIISGTDYLKQALKLYFSEVGSSVKADRSQATATPRKKRKTASVEDVQTKMQSLNCLLALVRSQETPSYLQRTILSLLSEVHNEHVLSLLLGMLHDLLIRCRFRSGLVTDDEATILNDIIRRFIPKTAALLQECVDDVIVALAAETDVIPLGKSPQKMILKQLTPAFFSAIPTSVLKQQLLSSLIDQQVATENSTVASRIGQTLRKLPLEAEQIVSELNKFQTDGKVTSLRDAKRAKGSMKNPTAGSWQRATHVLEFLQQMKLGKVEGLVQLIPALFNLLSRCIDQDSADQETSTEYLKQLILTTLLNICHRLSPDNQPLPADELSQEQFSVELIVQCIRTSEEPQTHRHALMLLATAAGLFPEHVLHNIMAIFTFMGAHMLHRDDSHSFQVIIRTVETVIPALIKVSHRQSLPSTLGGSVDEVIVMVMRVFVDAFPHIPEHRRLPLFNQLMMTVGQETYLSKMLALLIGGYITKGALAMHPGDEIDVKGPGRSLDFWLALCQQFSPEVQITSLTKLLEYVSTLTEDKETDKRRPSMSTRQTATSLTRHKASTNQEPIFSADPHICARQLRQFRFTAVCFMPYVVSNSDFVKKVVSATQEDASNLKKMLQRLLEVLLVYISQVAECVHHNIRKETAKFWKALLYRSYDALDKVNALLPAHIFIDVIAHLLGNKLSTIRRKAMDLLNNKLHQHQDYFGRDQNEGLLGLISSLLTIATATKDESMAMDQADVTRHTALYSLKLLCTLVGETNLKQFGPVLEASVQICEEDGVNTQVQGSAMLCLAECVRVLRAHSIRYLPRLMPRLLNVLASQETIVSSNFQLLSAVTGVQKVIETLPHFQSPYLVDILLQICRLSCNSEDGKSQLNLRLKSLSHNLASSITTRVLLPAFSQVYDRMVDVHKGSIGPLMAILSDHLSIMDKTDMAGYQPQLVAFFLVAMDYRAKHADESLDVVEGHVISAMLTLVMKMSEASFRPMFIKVVDWATRGTAPKERLLTLYRLSDAIADKLKSLFTLFAGHLVAKAADLLDINNTCKSDKLFFEGAANGEEKSSLLLTYILDCLHKCFLYDKGGFVSKERFQRLMQPLVDQIENMQGTDAAYQDRITNHVMPCIAQLLVASHDSSTWQPLNYQVLLKMRHSSPKVRFAALTVLQELHKKLAEDYLSLLPETIPFLAELMEDEFIEVEQQCQLVVNELEKTLGEPLQKYF